MPAPTGEQLTQTSPNPPTADTPRLEVPVSVVEKGERAGSGSNNPASTGERVGAGIKWSLLGVLAGVGVALVLWEIGVTSGPASFLLAASAISFYTRGAGVPPRRGLVGVLLIVLAGVLLVAVASLGAGLVTAMIHPPQQLGDDWWLAGLLHLANRDVWVAFWWELLRSAIFGILGAAVILLSLMPWSRPTGS